MTIPIETQAELEEALAAGLVPVCSAGELLVAGPSEVQA